MNTKITLYFAPMVITALLAGCATQKKVAPVAHTAISTNLTRPGHFCTIRMPKSTGIAETSTGEEQEAIGDCHDAYWEKTDVLVLYFGDPTKQETAEEFDKENSQINQDCEQCKITAAQRLVVHFRFDQYKPFNQDEINAVIHAAQAAGGNGRVINIAGYTDSTGDPRTNQALSILRAKEIRKILMKAGVKASITVQGNGAKDPVATNATKEGRAQNRRAEIKEHNDVNGN